MEKLTVKEKVKGLLDALERNEADDKVYFKKGAPEWARHVLFLLHDGLLPDDKKFEMAYRIFRRFGDLLDYCETEENLKKMEVSEIAAELVDVNTWDYISWLTPSRVSYVDEAIELLGEEKARMSFSNIMAFAQQLEYEDMIHIFLDFLFGGDYEEPVEDGA